MLEVGMQGRRIGLLGKGREREREEEKRGDKEIEIR